MEDFVVMVLVPILAVLALLIAIPAIMENSEPNPRCSPISVTNMSEQEVGRLIGVGFTSRADDGQEAVYAPGC